MHGNLGADGGRPKILGATAPQAPSGTSLRIIGLRIKPSQFVSFSNTVGVILKYFQNAIFVHSELLDL